ncbi:MAG: porin [Candidatus Azotimanducaceae bacterium WSBS_2022_MAG_OTU7]
MFRTAIALLIVAAAAPTQAEINISGYLKSFAVAQDELDNPLFQSDSIYQSQNSVRLMLDGFSGSITWQLHYELSPVLVSNSLPNSLPTGTPTFNAVDGNYRFSDPKSNLLGDGNKNKVSQNLDRLNFQLQMDAGDLTIGRQAISFGSARIINPTDIFLPFDVRTFNTEYRTGVDAVRFQRPWGELGEIDFGVVLGEDANSDNSAAFLQLRTNQNGTDYQLALIEFADQQLTGLGLQTALWDLGFWLEAAYVNGDESYLRLSTGVDYSFSENTFAQVEYHYNGAGSDDHRDYLLNPGSTPYQRGGVFLLGENYIMPGFTVQLSPLWFVATQAIYNLDDHSAFLSLSAEYNIAEDFYMDFGYYHFSGDDFSLNAAGLPDVESEYGPNPDTLFVSIRYYF